MMESSVPVDNDVRISSHNEVSSIDRGASNHLAVLPEIVENGTIRPSQVICSSFHIAVNPELLHQSIWAYMMRDSCRKCWFCPSLFRFFPKTPNTSDRGNAPVLPLSQNGVPAFLIPFIQTNNIRHTTLSLSFEVIQELLSRLLLEFY